VSQESAQSGIRAVGVVLPVHNEEELLPGALQALEMAVSALSPSISCRAAIVLDRCGDASSVIAHSWGARFGALVVRRDCRSVGLARQTGCETILAHWQERDLSQVWLATTDADSRVPQDWLTIQVEAHSSGADLWAGRVSVVEKSAAMSRWTERYAAERTPIHGASLGFSAALYTQLGGFGSLCSGEDRDFHHRAVAAGFRIAYDARTAVTTSSRRIGRAPGGFASVLGTVEQEELEATA
jgi:Glycosyl transferase family 2